MRGKWVHFILFVCGVIIVSENGETGFKQEQLKCSRVKTAFEERKESAEKLFANAKVAFPPHAIFLRVFKRPQIIELFAQSTPKNSFTLIKHYPICASSGTLGPKRKQGDSQVPEGVYSISGFNPWSNFFLSLRVDYPNRSDKILGEKNNLGGDIFIHGHCVTIGCIPLDDEIKELYLIAVEAKNNGQQLIPVHIFPDILDQEHMERLQKEFGEDKKLLSFWNDLKPIYAYFEQHHIIPKVRIGKDGRYLINSK